MELKANELRIGNWIKRTNKHDKSYVIYELVASCILDISSNGERSSFIYEPIPLTEEWLFRFGLSKENEYPYKFKKGYLKIKNGIFFFKYYDIKVDLLFVHQLQNLNFSLTNNELKLK